MGIGSMLSKLFGEDPDLAPERLRATSGPRSGGLQVEAEAVREINIPEIIMDRFQAAFARYLHKNALPMLIFRLTKIETLYTAENKRHLQRFIDLTSKDRNALAREHLANANSPDTVDLEQFRGWEILPATKDDAFEYEEILDLYEHESFTLPFRFYGQWVRRPDTGKHTNAAKKTNPVFSLIIRARGAIQQFDASSLKQFPLTIGRGSQSDIVVDSAMASRESVVITWNAKISRFVIENRGQNTVSADGSALARGATATLFQQGNIVIAADSPEPVSIDYRGAQVDQDQTPTVLAAPRHTSVPPPLSSGALAGAATSAVTAPPAPLPNAANTAPRGGAAPTVLSGDAGAAPTQLGTRVLAILEIRYSETRTERVAVKSLPLEIGREPDVAAVGQAVVIDASAGAVSRQHLRIEASGDKAFMVENRAFEKSGTWCEQKEMPRRFVIDATEGKWLRLADTVMVRLRRV